ncbi:hypothetical protein PtrV1_03507 [Pyrenophora tritici-repentis]|uniref:Uncharacterized protein n=1 Tax=Pyrenophora tritici-repentis TaxID=45151 RepID=A0A5M9LFJ7_9PLEO|nr:hypothetical protein PtrV1_03507 [Pyrenophora tritici-repentis]KAF7575724.1 hypothetical protein PtrM4_073480 [Pyrenophora tritici-repentis]KAI0568870.1 hypothetical protein Alg215_11953 [Pyrenophora tritici-repentis]
MQLIYLFTLFAGLAMAVPNAVPDELYEVGCFDIVILNMLTLSTACKF